MASLQRILNAAWYQERSVVNEAMAPQTRIFQRFRAEKAWRGDQTIYIVGGGFIFAMCSATDALDIALSAEGVDIVETPSTARRFRE